MLRFYHLLAELPFTASEMEFDYYQIKVNKLRGITGWHISLVSMLIENLLIFTMALKAICLPSASETLQECTVSSFHKTATHTSIKPGRHSTHPQNKIWPLNSPAYTSNLPSQPLRTVLAICFLYNSDPFPHPYIRTPIPCNHITSLSIRKSRFDPNK